MNGQESRDVGYQILAKFSAALLAAAVLGGCATASKQNPGPRPWPNPPAADSAVLFFYAERRDRLGENPTIYVDGFKVFTLKKDSYSWCYVKPGVHTVRTVWEGSSARLNTQTQHELKGGQTRFLRLLTTGQRGPGIITVQVYPVTREMAKLETEDSTFTLPLKARIE